MDKLNINQSNEINHLRNQNESLTKLCKKMNIQLRQIEDFVNDNKNILKD